MSRRTIALALAGGLGGAAVGQVVGVAGEALVADAVHVVVVHDAEGVGAAHGVGAGVGAELGAAAGGSDGGADLVVAAVGVIPEEDHDVIRKLLLAIWHANP